MRLILSCLFIMSFSFPAYADYKEAADYNAKANGIAMVVIKDGVVVFEDYINGGHSGKTVELYSGTKSFSSVIVALAVQDGLLLLDEKASETLVEWQTDPQKRNITIRQILSLTSGIDSPRPGVYPSYAEAINLPMAADPGEEFYYGPASFQIFGEIIRRKLEAFQDGKYKTPTVYLQDRVLDGIGVTPENWDVGEDNLPILSMGADVSAVQWARFGQFVLQGGMWQGAQLVDNATLGESVRGSSVNAAYGLAWWLNKKPSAKTLRKTRMMRKSTDLYVNDAARRLPEDLFMAAGYRDQRLYIIPSRNMVIVRQTDGEKRKVFKRWRDRRNGKTKQTEKFSDTAFLLKALDL